MAPIFSGDLVSSTASYSRAPDTTTDSLLLDLTFSSEDLGDFSSVLFPLFGLDCSVKVECNLLFLCAIGCSGPRFLTTSEPYSVPVPVLSW